MNAVNRRIVEPPIGAESTIAAETAVAAAAFLSCPKGRQPGCVISTKPPLSRMILPVHSLKRKRIYFGRINVAGQGLDNNLSEECLALSHLIHLSETPEYTLGWRPL